MDGGILERKQDHWRTVLEQDVAHRGTTLLECVQLLPCALPELALDEIDISTTLFGKPLSAPLMITSMTGGGDQLGAVNRRLAQAAGRAGIALALGSQRVLLRHPERLPEFAVRADFGAGVLLGNIGGQELASQPVAAIAGLVAAIEADGICVHLNPAHELAQTAGARDFRGILSAIVRLNQALDGRVVVKETGAGLSPVIARELSRAGIRWLDLAGAGGTSWTKVEGHRASEPLSRAVAETFADWGLPTAACIWGAREAVAAETQLIAGGGITTGLDVARALALGADLCGMARAAARNLEKLDEYLARVGHELKAALLLTGCRDLAALRAAARVYTDPLLSWLAQAGWRAKTE